MRSTVVRFGRRSTRKSRRAVGGTDRRARLLQVQVCGYTCLWKQLFWSWLIVPFPVCSLKLLNFFQNHFVPPSCSPRLPSFASDMALRQIHFILGSVVVAVAVSQVLAIVMTVSSKADARGASRNRRNSFMRYLLMHVTSIETLHWTFDQLLPTPFHSAGGKVANTFVTTIESLHKKRADKLVSKYSCPWPWHL